MNTTHSQVAHAHVSYGSYIHDCIIIIITTTYSHTLVYTLLHTPCLGLVNITVKCRLCERVGVNATSIQETELKFNSWIHWTFLHWSWQTFSSLWTDLSVFSWTDSKPVTHPVLQNGDECICLQWHFLQLHRNLRICLQWQLHRNLNCMWSCNSCKHILSLRNQYEIKGLFCTCFLYVFI